MRKLAILVTFIFCASNPSWPQEMFLDRAKAEIQTLTKLEKAIALRVAENVITAQLQLIVTDPQFRIEGPGFLLKCASFSYGTLALLAEENLSTMHILYFERTEIYADAVRGKISFSELQSLERKHEEKKGPALRIFLSTLELAEPKLNEERGKRVLAIGNRLGEIISAHAKIRAAGR